MGKRGKQPVAASTRPGSRAAAPARAKGRQPSKSATSGGVAADNIESSVIVPGHHNRIQISARPGAPPGLRKAYLNYVLETARRLSLEGVDPKAARGAEADTALSLDAVYTGLRTLTPEEQELKRGEASKKQRALLSGSPKGYVSALAALDEIKRLVLLGDPGSGKSTFVAFVALCLAAEGLGQKAMGIKALTRPLPKEDAGEDGDKRASQRWSHGAILPVRIVLRDFAARGLPAAGEKAKAVHLLDFIKRELPACCAGEFAPALERELREKGCLVLLDGLDEVPEAGQRRDQIKDAIVDFGVTFPLCRLLVTSRTYAYRRQGWRLAGFQERELAPFTPGQINEFVQRWYVQVARVRGMSSQDAEGRASLLLDAINASARLAELATRPLLLTLMASLHAWRGGTLPQRREELYSDAVDLLLDRWEAHRIVLGKDGQPVLAEPSLTEWLRVDRERVRELLDELAFHAHNRQPELLGTADITADELTGGLLRLTKDPDLKPGQVVEYLSARAGLVLPRGERVFTFPHRTFQEYLAACHLTRAGYPEELGRLVRADPERWREVALLAGAKAGRGAPFALWALIEELIPADDAEGFVAHFTALIAGQAVAESVDTAKLAARDKAKLDRTRKWLCTIIEGDALPARLRAEAGDVLAAIGDPRFRSCAEWCLPADEMLGFVAIPAGPFLMGSDKSRDKDAFESELPQHQVVLPDFLMARFPVTVGQFRCFVQATGMKLEDDAGLREPATRPMTTVGLDEAVAYCAWLDRELRSWPGLPAELRAALDHGKVTLPSEAEWEKAARGADSRIYPWGDEWNPERANTSEAGIGSTSAVGCFRSGKSPFRCEDMSGNVWQWTRSLEKSAYPAKPKARGKREAPGGNEAGVVVRGSPFTFEQRIGHPAYRVCFNSEYGFSDLGFRVVVSPSFSET